MVQGWGTILLDRFSAPWLNIQCLDVSLFYESLSSSNYLGVIISRFSSCLWDTPQSPNVVSPQQLVLGPLLFSLCILSPILLVFLFLLLFCVFVAINNM